MNFKDVDAYLYKVTPVRDPVLQSMEQYARKNGFPIIGPLVGRFLYQLAIMNNAKKVLELGSGYGYSAYWFSKAMGKNGKIIMTDTYEPNKDRAFDYFKKGKLKSKFDFRIGDALETAREIKGKFDIVLCDIDKQDYPETIEIASRLLKKGGVFVTDNIIWSGRVYDSSVRDKATKGIRRFTKQLYADDRFFTTVLPIRDGVALAIKQ
ncbi:MAG: O-methyltransferase [candidate division Zixibacteria bacterium]|nr:O-methyltransferase [candidate division Zixibacteria bacterium]